MYAVYDAVEDKVKWCIRQSISLFLPSVELNWFIPNFNLNTSTVHNNPYKF